MSFNENYESILSVSFLKLGQDKKKGMVIL